MTRPTLPPSGSCAPDLILVIPDSRLATLPAATVAGIRGLEAAYHGGVYYVTVPPSVYRGWREMEPPAP